MHYQQFSSDVENPLNTISPNIIPIAHNSPSVEIFNYSEWPELRKGERDMEFHLIYQGRLPAASQSNTRAKEKQEIRRAFHGQLKALWNTHAFLNSAVTDRAAFAGRYERCGFRFLPLISQWFMSSCALDILFLRRDGPGSIIRSGGDIDNRIKVLFDGLRMPQTCDEVAGDKPTADDEPFYCLLEDDKLISKIQVETNWLLAPPAPATNLNDVHLIIGVRTILANPLDFHSAFH